MPDLEENLETPEQGQDFFTGRRKLIIMILTMVVVMAVGIGAYIYFFRDNSGDLENINNSSDLTNVGTIQNANQGSKYTFGMIEKTEKDLDRDGLKDVEEVELGTSTKDADSDNDQLSDYEEVRVYKTDPLNSDSDNDGFTDGEEVRGGFDPLGPGKLLDTREAISEQRLF